MLQLHGDKYVLVTKSLNNPDATPNGIPLDGAEYFWVDWANNDRIVAGIIHDDYAPYGRIRTLHNSLISLNWDGTDQVSLAYEKSRGNWYDLGQGTVFDWLPDEPDHVLVRIMWDIYKLNILTNEYEQFFKSKAKVGSVYNLNTGSIRYIRGSLGGNGVRKIDLYRKSEDADFEKVFPEKQNEFDNPLTFEGLTDNPDLIYISKYDKEDQKSLYKYNVDKQEISEKVEISEDRQILDYSISADGTLEYYIYFDGKEGFEYLNESKKKVANIIKSNFPDQNFTIVDNTTDQSKFIIFIYSPTEPGSYYLLDLSANKLEMLGYNYQNIDPAILSDTEIVEYQTRDGNRVQGFLTKPKTSSEQTFPIIIYPHEGPRSHDRWKFDPIVQFLASQGYGVFQMNYRGSTGYGEGFTNLANEEWSNKVIEDINDGTKWLIEQGIVDNGNVCIFGSRFGGFAALRATIKDNDLYKCVAVESAYTDIYALRHGTYLREQYKNFRKEKQWSYKDISPVNNIDKINVPVLYINTASNFRRNSAQFSHFKDNMLDDDKDFTYVDYHVADGEYKDEDEDSHKLIKLNEYLAKHLKK